MAYYAGVDLGATNVRAIVADADGTTIGSDQRATPQGPTGIDVTEGVLRTLRAACADAGVAPRAVRAAGIGSIGPFDLAEGMIVDPANLPNTIDRVPLTGPVGKLIHSEEVYLHNDTTAGVIGERFHAARNPDDMVYLTISSGIGAGVCCDGQILAGWDGNVGEIGHWLVDPRERLPCGCGSNGHWEAYCSGNGIPNYAQLIADDDPTIETDLPLDDPNFSAIDVFDRVGEDDLATYTIDQVGYWNALGVANVVHAFAPILVSVGGAVATNNESLVVDPIRDRIGDMIMSNVPEVRLTALGDDVVVEGALASALTRGTGDRRYLGES